ncbi:MAG: PIN domain-containing protein [Nitrospirae bacterium]|nr:PIN domain-containing protein [Nitrospirota bacterium]
MKLYLDLCVYNRPFDEQRQARIVIETLEFILLLSKAIKKEITIVSSFTLEDENSHNPYTDRKDIISDLLELSSTYVDYDEDLEKRAKEIEKFGIMGIDALHIACAENAKADFFVTCDDILVKKCKTIEKMLKVKVRPLIRFVVEEVFK